MRQPCGTMISVAVGCLIIPVAACSERYIATANEDVLVIVDEVLQRQSRTDATVHYVLPRPAPLDGSGSEKVVSLKYASTFDCAARTSGDYAQELETESGRIVSQTYPETTMTRPKRDTVSASVVRVVCDPDARAAASSRRPLMSIRESYLRSVAE